MTTCITSYSLLSHIIYIMNRISILTNDRYICCIIVPSQVSLSLLPQTAVHPNTLLKETKKNQPSPLNLSVFGVLSAQEIKSLTPDSKLPFIASEKALRPDPRGEMDGLSTFLDKQDNGVMYRAARA